MNARRKYICIIEEYANNVSSVRIKGCVSKIGLGKGFPLKLGFNMYHRRICKQCRVKDWTIRCNITNELSILNFRLHPTYAFLFLFSSWPANRFPLDQFTMWLLRRLGFLVFNLLAASIDYHVWYHNFEVFTPVKHGSLEITSEDNSM